MQESPGLKPDWLSENKPLSRKKPNILLYKSLLLQSFIKFYWKLEVETLDDSFLRFVCHFFSELAQHKLFSTHMDIYHCLSEAVVPGCSAKKGVLENFIKFTGKHLCQSLQAWRMQLYYKRDSGTGVFLWFLWGF